MFYDEYSLFPGPNRNVHNESTSHSITQSLVIATRMTLKFANPRGLICVFRVAIQSTNGRKPNKSTNQQPDNSITQQMNFNRKVRNGHAKYAMFMLKESLILVSG